MRTINSGDVVKVQGYENGQQATVIKTDPNRGILVQMGAKSMYVNPDAVQLMCRSLYDENGNKVDLKLEIGDKVKYTYPNPPADPEEEQPLRYGEVVGYITEKRVLVRWVGSDEDKAERVSRLKWVAQVPEWYVRYYN